MSSILEKIKSINKNKIFKGHSSLKEWNLKELEGFLITGRKDQFKKIETNKTFYFNEYGKVYTDNIMKEFVKKNKKKGKMLYDIIKKGDISLNTTGHITVSSFLGFSLDKISFISLGFRKKIKMIEIKTDEGLEIILTKNQKLLTNYGYKKAKDITKEDTIIGIIGFSDSNFKHPPKKETNYINIFDLLNNIKNLILEKKEKEIKIKEIRRDLLEYLNILGINTSKGTLSLSEINFLINGLSKNKNDNDDENINLKKILINNHKNKERENFFCKTITSIEEVEIYEAYISSVIPAIAGNYIINNIILEK